MGEARNVFKEGTGELYGDAVIELQARRGSWHEVAVSVGGSTA